MKELIEKLSELYQDVEINGEVVAEGKRHCLDRMAVIRPLIGQHDVILDVGSAQGYFTHRIAMENPDSLVVSFEVEEASCELQKEIYRREGIYNVVLCNHRLSAEDIVAWSRCVDAFDVVLLLSILHHFPKDSVRRVLDSARVLSPCVVVEVTDNGETEACGGDAKDEACRLVREEEIIGYSRSHLGPRYTRKTYRLGGRLGKPIIRGDLDAYLGVSHEGRHKFNLEWSNWEWKLGGKRIIKGVNVHNLLQFNPVWPEKAWWKAQAVGAYSGLHFKSDVRPWNLLMTPTGLKAIDHTHVYPKGDQAEFKDGDMEKLLEVFDV